MSKSTQIVSASKPKKPYPEFPLFAHATKRWAKKIRGKTHYFGHWDDPQAALDKYMADRDALHAGLVPDDPGTTANGHTVADLCNSFMIAKDQQRDTGEITERTRLDYLKVCKRVVKVFGKTLPLKSISAPQFQKLRDDISRTYGLVTLSNEIGRCRVLFNYAYEAGQVERPFRYGTFKKPSKKALRRQRRQNGKKMFESAQIRILLDHAGPQMRAMILLGINCGFGNEDCGSLPIEAVNFKKGWIDFPRPKTGVERQCPLWPETVKALDEVLKRRPSPRREAEDRVFVTKYGGSWNKHSSTNPVSSQFRKLTKAIDKAAEEEAKKDGVDPPAPITRAGVSFTPCGIRSKPSVAAAGTKWPWTTSWATNVATWRVYTARRLRTTGCRPWWIMCTPGCFRRKGVDEAFTRSGLPSTRCLSLAPRLRNSALKRTVASRMRRTDAARRIQTGERHTQGARSEVSAVHRRP